MAQRVVIDDNQLIEMASQSKFVSRFPFLAPLASLKGGRGGGGCLPCQRDDGRKRQLNAAKAALAGMDADAKRSFKEMLGASQVRVRYVHDRRTYDRTF